MEALVEAIAAVEALKQRSAKIADETERELARLSVQARRTADDVHWISNPGMLRRLPPARHIAAVLGVNTNKALRALRAPGDEGLLEMRPRRGIHVVGTPVESEIRGKVAELVQLARQQGYTQTELHRMIITNTP